MAYLPEAQRTPWQQSEEIDLKRTAVLVIDVLGGSGGVVPGLEEMAENAVRIVKAARKAGVPVVFVNDAHIAGIDKEIELWGEHGIAGSDADTLIAFGCDTNICVLQTLAGAYFRGYKTVVPADACGTFLVGTQEQGLEYFTRCYDSRVVDTETALGYLGASA